MLSSATTLLTATLAGLAIAAPAVQKRDAQIIGYRTCSKDEGTRLNNEGLFYNGAGMGQIGEGVSTSANPGGWEATNPDDMFCVIKADSGRMEAVSKCWIPEYYDKAENWYDEGAIDDYIEHFDVGWNAPKTIRLGIVDGHPDVLELLIPKDLVGDASMAFTVQCFDTVEELPTDVVNYDAWQDNIKGDRTPSDDDLPDDDDDD